MRSWTKEILTENKYDIGNKRNGEQTQHKEQRSLTEKDTAVWKIGYRHKGKKRER